MLSTGLNVMVYGSIRVDYRLQDRHLQPLLILYDISVSLIEKRRFTLSSVEKRVVVRSQRVILMHD
jgi:hypothetical protein